MTWIRRVIAAALFTSLAVAGGCSKQSESQRPASDNETEPAASEAAQAEATPVAPEAEEGASGARMAVASTVRGPGGAEVDLASAWQDGPAVVVFYRGHW